MSDIVSAGSSGGWWLLLMVSLSHVVWLVTLSLMTECRILLITAHTSWDKLSEGAMRQSGTWAQLSALVTVVRAELCSTGDNTPTSRPVCQSCVQWWSRDQCRDTRHWSTHLVPGLSTPWCSTNTGHTYHWPRSTLSRISQSQCKTLYFTSLQATRSRHTVSTFHLHPELPLDWINYLLQLLLWINSENTEISCSDAVVPGKHLAETVVWHWDVTGQRHSPLVTVTSSDSTQQCRRAVSPAQMLRSEII